MDKDIEKTLKKRYDFLILKVNEIWKLEKEKAKLRNKKQSIRKEINSGKKQAGKTISSSPDGNAAGAIGKNEEILNNTKDQIENIAKNQCKLLEDIKSSIINI